MEIRIRTTRTLKVTEINLSPQEKENLAQLYDDPRYLALLDVMERACIALETAHLSSDVGNPEAILGGHAMAKSVWLFFTYVQRQINNAYQTREVEPETKPAEPTLEEVLQGVELPLGFGRPED